MNILIDHRESGYFYGGAENHIRGLSKKLLERKHKIIILTEKGKTDTLEFLKKNPNFKVIYLPSLKLRRSKKFKTFSSGISKKVNKRVFLTGLSRVISNSAWIIKSGIWMTLNKKKFDVVWVCKYTDTFLLKFLNKFARIPFVESLEGYDYVEAENAKGVKFVYTISDFIIDQCKNVHGFEPEFITIGVDRDKFDKINSSEMSEIKKRYGNKKMVLNVARLVDSKDIPTYIRSCGEVIKKFGNVVFIVCGDGEEKDRLQELIKKLKLEKNFFIPPISGESDIIKYYKSSDIFVHVPKTGNHFGIVYIEAMTAGLPIVASNVDASPKTVEGCALLVKPGDVRGMAQSVEKLLKDKKLRDKLSKNSLKRAKSVFDWDKITSKMESLFSKAASSY